MLGDLFGALLKLSNPMPRYIGSRCLVEKQVVDGCTKCMDACPHQAIEISDHVKILEDNCTGCGLCVQACPTAALEYDLTANLLALKNQGIKQQLDGEEKNTAPVAQLRCSKITVDELPNVPSIECLGRVTPALLMVSAAWGQELELLYKDCANCKLGSKDVPNKVQAVIDQATQYRSNLENPRTPVRILRFANSNQAINKIEMPDQKQISRREVFGSWFGQAKRGAAQMIPEQPIPGIDTTVPASRIPDEWTWRKKSLTPKPAPIALQYWPLPEVNDACIMCPVCENVCPTKALWRVPARDGTYAAKLYLEPEACVGCNACVVSCPPNAMTLKPQTTFGIFENIQMLFDHKDEMSEQSNGESENQ